MNRKDIKSFTLEEMEKALSSLKIPSFRSKQIYAWLYKKGVESFDDMTNIPLELRQRLDEKYYISSLILQDKHISKDGVMKLLFRLSDNKYIESVIIRGKKRATLCISTQVGCKMVCKFCASGEHGFVRNLKISEILSQILYVKYVRKLEITNYVFMGMGEPLDNYENVTKAITIMNDPRGMGIAGRRITVSTCGLAPEIEKLKNFGIQINLSISLHATTQNVRTDLMPISTTYSLNKVLKAAKHYYDVTKRAITLEYALIEGVNDSLLDAANLISFSKDLHAKVNLIPFSASSKRFQPSSEERVRAFIAKLKVLGDRVSVRKSRGSDINAACGQLAGRMGNN